ncbi:hypothetical protein ACTOB_001347 [Actinoplanes oblitus]|uniref:Uncharacterized protein n=1 Tax=Actinoplanes oblitus TaxID=3040509 RepID=A0ABY8WJ08_9ACTN|nr:hypothetical protein [Actinoplanes oblitus]WIM97795.1 hypothetical protein ACTOB_001347 [Actinoplanes oblitus]
MRLRHPSGRIVHLICGVSLTGARTLTDAFAIIDATAAELRAGLLAARGEDPGRLGVALRLPYSLAAALVDDGRARTRLRAELDARGIEVVTLNGGPGAEGGGSPPLPGSPDAEGSGPPPLPGAPGAEDAGSPPLPGGSGAEGADSPALSGGPGAEDAGSAPLSGGSGAEGGSLPPLPDWSQPARLQHTLGLARILVDLLPDEEVRGAVSTCGLARRADWDEAHEKAVARHVARLSGGLADLAWRVGRAVRAGFEPGPGQVLDSPEDTVAALTRVDKDRLGLCLDLARVVRDWPAPRDGVDRLTDAGLSVITVRVTDPSVAWQPVLRHLLAADTARTEYIEVDAPGSAAVHLAYVIRELTALGLVPEGEPCNAP